MANINGFWRERYAMVRLRSLEETCSLVNIIIIDPFMAPGLAR